MQYTEAKYAGIFRWITSSQDAFEFEYKEEHGNIALLRKRVDHHHCNLLCFVKFCFPSAVSVVRRSI